MLGLVGGLPSSGTTALLHLVARSDGVRALHETGIFAHPGAYGQYSEFKANFLGILRSKGFGDLDESERLRKGISPHVLANSSRLRECGVEFGEVVEAVSRSGDVAGYIEALTALFLGGRSAAHLIEKTPSNIYAYRSFLDGDPARRVVATVRDPLDNVASLTSRGIPRIRAIGMWMVDAAIIASLTNRPGMLVVPYERMIADGDATIDRLRGHFGLEGPVLGKPSIEVRGIPSAWRNQPWNAMSTSSVGRGLAETDSVDRALFSRIRLVDAPSMVSPDLVGRSGRHLAEALGYALEDDPAIGDDRVAARYATIRVLGRRIETSNGRSSYYDNCVAL